MGKEMEQFKADLLASVRQMKGGQSAKRTCVPVSDIMAARNRIHMSQSGFAKMMGVSKRTLQSWEQGTRSPSDAAQRLLKVAMKHPEALRDI